MIVFLFTSVYRFNTLGGTFGGFDNDHFVPFAYAKQVQAGLQPLRDFSGLGLQGAWPSLTYEVSAWGQRWLGNNLRSEAVVTIAGVAFGAAMTFVVASFLSNTFWAAVVTPISVFVAPTLYNYPKVLLLSAVGLVIVWYARRPTRVAIGSGAVLTAIAFLFRHDYAVFAGVGFVLCCVLASGLVRGSRHAAIYAALTMLLLIPSLLYVVRYSSVTQYLHDSIEVSRREAERTGLSSWPAFTRTDDSGQRVRVAAFFTVEQNGVSWLYYVMRLLPFAAAYAAWRARRETGREWLSAATLAFAAMAAFAVPFLVRGNVAVRLGDVGPFFSVLLAVVCAEAVRRRAGGRLWIRTVSVVVVLVFLGVTAMSAATVGYVRTQMNTAGLSRSWADMRARTQQLSEALGALPEAAVGDPRPDNPLRISRYINQCTMPADRVVMMAYEPQTLPYAGRLFGAGRLSVIPKYILGPENEAELVSFWQREPAPLVLVEFDEFLATTGDEFPLIRRHLRDHYHQAGTIVVSSSKTLRVFASNDRAVVSAFGPEQLPCFR